jgi:MFS family permease
MAGSGPSVIYLGAFLFGAFALPLYSLSVAHAMDFARKGQFVVVAAGLMFVFACGACVGPLAASLVIERFGAPAFFAYTSIIHTALIAVALVRMAKRPTPPAGRRSRFVGLLRTSQFLVRLAGRRGAAAPERIEQRP